MSVVNITVKDRIATADADALIICNNKDYTIVFDFDEEWDGIDVKTARIYYDGKYDEVIFEENTCVAPPVDNARSVEIGVYGGDFSTTPATVQCKIDIQSRGGVNVPRSDVYAQIMEQYNKIDEKAAGLKTTVYDNPIAIYPDEESLIRVYTEGETVTRCGRNMIPYPYMDTTKTTNGVTFTDNGDGSITINGTPTATAYFNLCTGIYFGSDYVTVQSTTAKNGFAFGLFTDEYDPNATALVSGISASYEGASGRKLFIRASTGYTFGNIIIWPQVERGSAATQWEPYQGEVIPVSDGVAEIRAISGVNTLYNEGAGDLLLMVEYNKSLVRTIEELRNAIISLGGNV